MNPNIQHGSVERVCAEISLPQGLQQQQQQRLGEWVFLPVGKPILGSNLTQRVILLTI